MCTADSHKFQLRGL
uniref:TOR n=1 Tax=Arundo donax TaxID=35708 RepID=A0A0A9F4Q4_ARUDO